MAPTALDQRAPEAPQPSPWPVPGEGACESCGRRQAGLYVIDPGPHPAGVAAPFRVCGACLP